MDTVPNLSVSATGSIVQLWKSVIRCSHECQWVVIAHDCSTWSQFVSSGSSQSFRRLEAMEQRLLALEKVLMSEPIESLQEANVGLTADLLCFWCFLDKSDVASQRPAGSMCLMASKPPTLRLWRFLFASLSTHQISRIILPLKFLYIRSDSRTHLRIPYLYLCNMPHLCLLCQYIYHCDIYLHSPNRI